MKRYEKGLLRYTSSGGAPLDPAWKREAEAFYGVALQNGYGLTESTSGVCATKNAFGDPDNSVGVNMLGSEKNVRLACERTFSNTSALLARCSRAGVVRRP